MEIEQELINEIFNLLDFAHFQNNSLSLQRNQILKELEPQLNLKRQHEPQKIKYKNGLQNH